MRFAGKLFVCAYLHARATVGDAVRAVKADVLRSLGGRVTMHCDSLVSAEEASGDEEEPQVRVITGH